MAMVLAYNMYSLDHWYQMSCQPSMMPRLLDTLVLPALSSKYENIYTGMVYNVILKIGVRSVRIAQ